MFQKTVEQIFSISNLQESAFLIKSKSIGIDKQSIIKYRDNKELLKNLSNEIISGNYTPNPLQKIDIQKDDNQKRPITISSAKDKIVQKTLVNELTIYFDKTFSDKSYGYRPRKSVLKAINRAKDYIQRGYKYIYKTDIDNFFETINHKKLLDLLDKNISDKRIIDIITIFLKNGGFKSFNYLDHLEGVHQGDILSPLLSNIYLDQMDKWLEKNNIEFVRFADDFVLFF